MSRNSYLDFWKLSTSRAYIFTVSLVGSSPAKWIQSALVLIIATLIIYLCGDKLGDNFNIEIGPSVLGKFVFTGICTIIAAAILFSIAFFSSLFFVVPFQLWRDSLNSGEQFQSPLVISACLKLLRIIEPVDQSLAKRLIDAKAWLKSNGTVGDVPISEDLFVSSEIEELCATIGNEASGACMELRRTLRLALDWRRKAQVDQGGDLIAAGMIPLLADIKFSLENLGNVSAKAAGLPAPYFTS